jgi:hypothetical protein
VVFRLPASASMCACVTAFHQPWLLQRAGLCRRSYCIQTSRGGILWPARCYGHSSQLGEERVLIDWGTAAAITPCLHYNKLCLLDCVWLQTPAAVLIKPVSRTATSDTIAPITCLGLQIPGAGHLCAVLYYIATRCHDDMYAPDTCTLR